MVKASRTINPLHFEDLGGHRFEDLVRQVLHNFRDWFALEATGRSGSDNGIDIRGFEPARYLEGPGRGHLQDRLWIIQCKNYRSMGPAEVRKIVANDLEKQSEMPYGYMLVAACTFSKRAYDAFREEVSKYGVQQSLIWGKGELEDHLFMPKNAHLLKAYFGISIHDQTGGKPEPPIDLPLRAEHFTGREKEIKQLIADLQPGGVVTLSGPGGIGKTALAVEVLYRLTAGGVQPPDLFPDGILTYNFFDRPEVNLALEYIVLSLGGKPVPTPQVAARSLLPGKRALLVLDNAEWADDLDTILQVHGQCCLLITSRDRGDIHQAYQELVPLPGGEAKALLSDWGREYIDDPADAERICELVGGLPLALRLVGKYLFEYGERASEYLTWLEETPLEALDQGKRRDQSIPLLLAQSLEQVSEPGVNALGVAGLLGLAPFDVELAAAGLGIKTGPARRALGELVRIGLLTRDGSGYLVSHPLVHTYARQQIQKPEGCLERLVELTSRLAMDANLTGLPHRFKPLKPHIQALAETAKAPGSLWNELGYHLIATGEFSGAKAAFEHALESDEAIYGPDHPIVATVVNNLGLVLRELGDYSEARTAFERALEIDEVTYGPDHNVVAGILNNLGMVLRELGNHQAAMESLSRALAIWKIRLGSGHPQVAVVINNLGELLRDLGNNSDAKSAYETALKIWKATVGPDHPQVATGTNNLGLALRDLGDYSGAKAAIERALKIDEAVLGRDHPNVARDINNLGSVLQAMEDHTGARAAFERALGIFEHSLGPSHLLIGMVLNNLGTVLSQLNECTEARSVLERARMIFTESLGPEHLHVGSVYMNLGEVKREQGDLAGAQFDYEQALNIWEKTLAANHLNIATACHKLGEVLRDQGYYTSARPAFERAIKVWEQNLSPVHPQLGFVSNDLGLVRLVLGDQAGAREAFERALQIFRFHLPENHPNIKIIEDNLEQLG
jgi:tetratricopeptide (TPR) repeat protein